MLVKISLEYHTSEIRIPHVGLEYHTSEMILNFHKF